MDFIKKPATRGGEKNEKQRTGQGVNWRMARRGGEGRVGEKRRKEDSKEKVEKREREGRDREREIEVVREKDRRRERETE